MNSLLPISASPFERNVAQACAGIDAIPVPLREIWNPDTCPVALLPYLAWARSVDRWDESWPEATKRTVIRAAFVLHQRKGTITAIRRVIENVGYSMSIKEWWEVGDHAGTFHLTINLNNIGISYTMANELERIIDDVKPVSRHISQLNLIASSEGFIYSGTAGYEGDVTTTFPDGYRFNREIRHDETIHYDGLNNHSGFHYD